MLGISYTKITAVFTEDSEDILQNLLVKMNSSCSEGHISSVSIFFLLCESECLLNIIMPDFIAPVFCLESYLVIVETQN